MQDFGHLAKLVLKMPPEIDIKDPDRIAANANRSSFDDELTRNCPIFAPHINHKSLRDLYLDSLRSVFARAKERAAEPRVLDLGAGEGSVTVPMLQLGARVTAVDISPSQLGEMERKCRQFAERITIHCKDVNEFLAETGEEYDIVVANSFLHHVPDYLGMIGRAVKLLGENGQFFSFQDPMRYDTLPVFTRLYSGAAYAGWRLFDGDVIGGLKRYVRRKRGVYLDDSPEDNTEFHATRNGVDQDAIAGLLKERGFTVRMIPYFSTHHPVFQKIGEKLGVADTFGIIAERK